MKQSNALPAVLVCLAAGAAALSGHAQDDDITLDRNRVWVNARFAFNISAEFRTVSAPAPSVAPSYDDGYVLPDISGSQDGKTWYWGYNQANQVVGDSLSMHLATGSPRVGFSETKGGDVQAGFDIVYGRVLGFFNLSEKRKAAWGVLGGFGSLDVNLDTTSTVTGTMARSAYRYSLGGILPPLAPYAGTYGGPGPVIDTAVTPVGSAVVPATSTLYSRIDAMALGFKLGPFVELPISSRFSVDVSAGVAAVDTLTTYEYQETITIQGMGGPPPVRSEELNHDEWLIGFFANASLSYALNYNLTVFAGVQYQYLGDVTVTGGGKEATLRMGQVIEATAGLRLSF